MALLGRLVTGMISRLGTRPACGICKLLTTGSQRITYCTVVDMVYWYPNSQLEFCIGVLILQVNEYVFAGQIWHSVAHRQLGSWKLELEKKN